MEPGFEPELEGLWSFTYVTARQPWTKYPSDSSDQLCFPPQHPRSPGALEPVPAGQDLYIMYP